MNAILMQKIGSRRYQAEIESAQKRVNSGAFSVVGGIIETAWRGAASSNVWFIDRLAPAPILRRGTKAVLTTSGTTTNASAVLTALGSTLNLGQEFGVTGTGIPAGARIMSVDSASQVTLDLPCSASASGVSVTFLNDHAATLTALPADATHPNQAGHNLDALWMARALRSLILTELA